MCRLLQGRPSLNKALGTLGFRVDKGPELGISPYLGFGVPYFNTFFLNGTIMKYKFILFLPGY